MQKFLVIAAALSFLVACAVPPEKSTAQKKLEIRCRTHATQVTASGEADVQMPYLECIRTKGSHDIEVIEVP